MEHYSKVLEVPVKRAFEYFTAFEEFEKRYPRYCARIDVIEKTFDRVITEEFWNMALGNDISHVKLKVEYVLTPNQQIQYKIIDGSYGKGTTNIFRLEDRGDKTHVLANVVPLDVYSLFYGKHDLVYLKMVEYFIRRDSIVLEGKKFGWEDGDPCPFCEDGKLEKIAKTHETETRKERRRLEFFKCNKCEKECESAYLHV